MGNTSATGGFLELHDVPVRTSLGDAVSGGSRFAREGGAEEALPPEHLSPPQERLDDVLHDLIAGVTGLPGELVRPRWQPDPPETPEPDVNWCAFGITQFDPANFPALIHHGEGEGYTEIVDTEDVHVLASFYGPLHMVHARTLRRGLHVSQNRAALRPAGLAFVKAGPIVPLPAMVAFGWRSRADIPLVFRLETRSGLEIRNLKQCGGCGGFIETDTGVIASLEACKE